MRSTQLTYLFFCGKKNGCKLVVAGAEGGLHFLVPVKQNSMDGMVES